MLSCMQETLERAGKLQVLGSLEENDADADEELDEDADAAEAEEGEEEGGDGDQTDVDDLAAAMAQQAHIK